MLYFADKTQHFPEHTHTHTQKEEPKNKLKNKQQELLNCGVIDPQKWWFYQGKTIGYGTKCFRKKTIVGVVVRMESLALKSCILQRVFEGFGVSKKMYLLDPLGTFQTRKRSSGVRMLTILEDSLLKPQKCPRQPNLSLKMAPSPPVSVPDSTHHTHPCTHTCFFVNLKPQR